jgi:glycosyltransferase involved in cell wall biosynthesis
VRRVVVVSHPCVEAVNQSVYVALRAHGWEPTLVVPARWRHAYRPDAFRPSCLPELEEAVLPVRVVFPGRPQRHVYAARPGKLLRRLAPDVLFVEQEPFSLAALQWGTAASRAGLPFGVQADENLDRPLPAAARAIRSTILRRAAFVAARSPAAAELVRRFGAVGEVAIAPHAVPPWREAESRRNGVFTIGFAGRLVPEKGILDLVRAVRGLEPPIRLLIVGNGPLRAELERTRLPNGDIDLQADVGHAQMPEAYARMDVLAAPSRTTALWAEQFGRVLVEALSCGVPVVGSDSGEIPWVIGETGGGIVVPEGDNRALTTALSELRGDPARRCELATRGREASERLFGVAAAARALHELLDTASKAKP